MFKVRFIVVGKLKEQYLKAAQDEYLKRLTRFCKAEVIELPERATLKEEAVDILRTVRGYSIALAVEGKSCTSEEFAKKIQGIEDRGDELSFIIGSSCGLAQCVKENAKELVSFSQMTFPHQLMRIILLEQTYRAFMINAGAEYHK